MHVSHEYVALANSTYTALKQIVRNSQHGFCTTAKALDDADALVLQMHAFITQHAAAETQIEGEQHQVHAALPEGPSVAAQEAVHTEGGSEAGCDAGSSAAGRVE